MTTAIRSPLKAVALLGCIVQFVLLRGILHAMAPDAAFDWDVLLMLVAATLTSVELIIGGHLLNIESLKIDFHDPAARIGAAGLGLGYVLAIALLFFHSADRRAANEMRQQSDGVRSITRGAEENAAKLDPDTMKMIQQRAAQRK